jgi:nucleotide-binding universal stress UspA family protein
MTQTLLACPSNTEPARTPPPRNLPAQPTPLVDRVAEVAAARRLVSDEGTRLLTLVGPGGAGKTRLALTVAEALLGAFPDGVWLVDLPPVPEPGAIVLAVAGVLGVRDGGGRPPAVADLLRACPGLAVLATSREPLRLRGYRDQMAQQLARSGPAIQTSARPGTDWQEIRATARDQAADVIVMPTHGRTGPARRILGSVVERVVRFWAGCLAADPAFWRSGVDSWPADVKVA